jgi:hypothetical protein
LILTQFSDHPTEDFVFHCLINRKPSIIAAIINRLLVLLGVFLSESNWTDQDLTIFSGFQIVRVKLKFVQSCLFLPFLFSIQVNPDQSVSVALSNYQNLFAFVFTENDSVGKVESLCNQTQLSCLFVELEDSAERIVEPEIDLKSFHWDRVAGLSEVNDVWVFRVDLNSVERNEKLSLVLAHKNLDFPFLDVKFAQSKIGVGKVQQLFVFW